MSHLSNNYYYWNKVQFLIRNQHYLYFLELSLPLHQITAIYIWQYKNNEYIRLEIFNLST